MLTAQNVTPTPYGPTVTPVTVSHTGLEIAVMSKPTVDHATTSVSDVLDKDQTNALSVLTTLLAMLTDTVSVTPTGMEMTALNGLVSATQSVVLVTDHSTATVMSAYQMPPGVNSTHANAWPTGQVMTVVPGAENVIVAVTLATEMKHVTVMSASHMLTKTRWDTEPVSVMITGPAMLITLKTVPTGWDHATQSVTDVLAQIAVIVSTVYITLP